MKHARTGFWILAAALCAQALLPAFADGQSLHLSPLETRVFGRNRWLAGGQSALRVIVTNHQTGLPLRANVSLSLATAARHGGHRDARLFEGATDALGTLDAGFRVPRRLTGACDLAVTVTSPLGRDTVHEAIQVEDSAQILLTSDKPIYQPGQVIRMRALAMDLASRAALGGRPITLEVEDGRSNKVFKQTAQLSAFGVASADFQLADEVNMGVFTLRAIMAEGQVEKKVRVERYVLPKFKITLTPDRPWYRPGETLHATLNARYFFGKPVTGAQVNLDVDTVDIGTTRLAQLRGVTDASGRCRFTLALPGTFIGQPFEQGKAALDLHAVVKDTADHVQDAHVTAPVVQEPIVIAVVPETRALVPGIPNRIYVAVATPDGKPLAGAHVRVNAAGASSTGATDNLGLAAFTFTPPGGAETIQVEAADPAGHVAAVTRSLTSTGPEGLILRASRTIVRVGDRLTLTALSTVKGGTTYLDVIRDGQTILTRAEPAVDGQAAFALPLTAEMAGTLEIHAYKILPNEDIIRDTRLVIVQPANDLDIAVSADRTVYRPGAEAVLRFRVGQDGRPVSAALGLSIVDESVFALSELEPGLAKVYFTLERDLMTPRYEIHGLSPARLILRTGVREPSPAADAQRQRAAAMLLAAAPEGSAFDFTTDTYLARWEKVRDAAVRIMAEASRKIYSAVLAYQRDTGSRLSSDQSLIVLVTHGRLEEKDLLDPWGAFYRTTVYGGSYYDRGFNLSSAGPDGRWGTPDDILDVSMYADRVMGGGFGPGGFGGGGGGFGGRPGGLRDGGMMFVPEAALEERAVNRAGLAGNTLGGLPDSSGSVAAAKGAQAGAAAPRVREFFPETMYWNPALITDGDGRAEARVPLADSITTWRLSLLANTVSGALGSATAPIKVFQDFFVDIDLPIALTQHDRADIPVSLYNYLPAGQDVQLSLGAEPWFTLHGPASQHVHVDSGQVRVVYFPIEVTQIGRFTLTVAARGTRLSDAVRRNIDVLPDGEEQERTLDDRLEGTVEKTVSIPAGAIPGASAIWVKIYPGAFSQVVEGLDGMLQMPYGCFEQTSSTTYPNVLVLGYLKANRRIDPELQMKAEGYINIGYQRLVTFECKNGGFSWFGNEPANQILTAYGLLEFTDMAKVHDVDPALIQRTQRWLAGRQRQDGSWLEQGPGIAEGIINRQTGALRATAYVAWALAESGYRGPEVARGVAYVKSHVAEARDPYTLAVILNLLVSTERDGDATAQAADQLMRMAKTTDRTAWWQSVEPTFTGAIARGADMETTGLATYALVEWGRSGAFTTKALTYIVRRRDGSGTWGTTQGTVWCMKALLAASGAAVGGGTGTVVVSANGAEIGRFDITDENSDVMRQISLGRNLVPGANRITVQYTGSGAPLYQIETRYYLPWQAVPQPRPRAEVLALAVAYDKSALAQNDTAGVAVTIHNNTDRIVEMPLVDVGVPPGFTVLTDGLDGAVAAHTISKYTIAARQVILYLDRLAPFQTVTVRYRVQARFPIKARTPLSKAYPYYNPEQATVVAPAAVTVVR